MGQTQRWSMFRCPAYSLQSTEVIQPCVWCWWLHSGTVGWSLLLVLTLLGALVAGVLQRQADGTVVSCAIFPVGDDLSGWRTVSHCREKETEREINRVYNLAGLSLPCVVNTKYLTLSLLGWEVVLPISKGNSSHFSDNFCVRLLYVNWP